MSANPGEGFVAMQNDSKTPTDPDDGLDDVSDDDEKSFEDEMGDTVVMSETDFTDNVGDVSVEINVEELVAKVESEQSDDSNRKKMIRQRLEEVAEDKSFEDTYAVDFDEDAD